MANPNRCLHVLKPTGSIIGTNYFVHQRYMNFLCLFPRVCVCVCIKNKMSLFLPLSLIIFYIVD